MMHKHHVLEACHRGFYSHQESNIAYLLKMYGKDSIEFQISQIPSRAMRLKALIERGLAESEVIAAIDRANEYNTYSNEEMVRVQTMRFEFAHRETNAH